MDLNWFSLPQSATGSEFPIGYDEAGNPVRRSRLGATYTAKPQASPEAESKRALVSQMVQGLQGNPLYSLEQARIDAGRNAVPTGRDMARSLVEGAIQGFTAPGRAAAGKPVTNGDAWATALDYGLLAAPVPKPAGALGAGGLLSKGAPSLQDSLKAKYPGVKISISEGPRGITLNRIEVPQGQRGFGIGTQVMDDFVRMADESGAIAKLDPSSDFGGTPSRLRKFYKRFGFVENKGRAKDYEISEDMYRLPEPPAPQGIRAYHGTPHDFDRFDMSKIGTGEGAQAYGHGLYFAENEGVARGYRDALRWQGSNWDDPRYVARFWLDKYKGDHGAAAEYLAGAMRHQSTDTSKAAVSDAIGILKDGGKGLDAANPGHMYEVNINADPADFLDWDAPLSGQPESVRRFASERWQKVMGREPDPTIEGEYIAKMASPQHGIDGREWLDTGPAADQARRLREAGIPGIKYRDAGSRGMDGADGTRNFVVFDENLIEIVRKYGIAGAAALTGMTVAEIEAGMGQAQAAPSAATIESYLAGL